MRPLGAVVGHVLCCGGLLLVVVGVSGGLGAWAGDGGRVLPAVGFALAAIGIFLLWRRTR